MTFSKTIVCSLIHRERDKWQSFGVFIIGLHQSWWFVLIVLHVINHIQPRWFGLIHSFLVSRTTETICRKPHKAPVIAAYRSHGSMQLNKLDKYKSQSVVWHLFSYSASWNTLPTWTECTDMILGNSSGDKAMNPAFVLGRGNCEPSPSRSHQAYRTGLWKQFCFSSSKIPPRVIGLSWCEDSVMWVSSVAHREKKPP